MKILTIGFLTIFLFASNSLAQKLNVSVKVQYEHLIEEAKDELSDFGMKIEEYFNGYYWVDDEFEYDVNCNAQVIIETVQKKTHEIMFRAQFLISSESGENFYDKLWEFPYEKNYSLSHSRGQFDPVAQFLDYYALMVLAGELDTNGLLLGNPLYEAAQDIVNQALLSQYARGWNQRKEDLLKITDIRTRPLREIKPDLFEAIYLLEENKKAEALKYAQIVLAGIKKVYNVQPNNWYLQMFFKTHYRNMAILFSGRNEELERLTTYDSKHRESYRNQMN